jgi:thiamine pyrophosphate-dependent acetolactate synthase large subunit-like protein
LGGGYDGFKRDPRTDHHSAMTAFGAKGYFVATPEALAVAVKDALATNAPTLVNTMISPYGQRKAQVRMPARADPKAGGGYADGEMGARRSLAG